MHRNNLHRDASQHVQEIWESMRQDGVHHPQPTMTREVECKQGRAVRERQPGGRATRIAHRELVGYLGICAIEDGVDQLHDLSHDPAQSVGLEGAVAVH